MPYIPPDTGYVELYVDDKLRVAIKEQSGKYCWRRKTWPEHGQKWCHLMLAHPAIG
jgi:hypothetical protein